MHMCSMTLQLSSKRRTQAVKVKTIIETCLLTDVEAVACIGEPRRPTSQEDVNWIQRGGATAEDVAPAQALSDLIGVKAAGGTLDDLRRMVAAGATHRGQRRAQIMQDLAGSTSAKSGLRRKAGEAY